MAPIVARYTYSETGLVCVVSLNARVQAERCGEMLGLDSWFRRNDGGGYEGK